MRHAPRPVGLVAAVLAIPAFGCSGGGSEPPPEYPAIEEPEGVDVPPDTEPQTDVEPPPAPPPVTVAAGESTPLDGAAPTLRIVAPRNGQVVRTGPVMLRVRLSSWELAADPGNHIHVIVDNEPYIAVRDVSQPIDLSALVQQNLQHELAPGSHVLRVFPSRAHHESVKLPGAFGMVVFHVGQRTEGFAFDARAPLLTYSRPKGCYPAGERILLDFFVSNGALAPAEARTGVHDTRNGMLVQYEIAGQNDTVSDWVPYWIENLPEGEHSLTLRLVDGEGALYEGPFNETTRTIRIGACE